METQKEEKFNVDKENIVSWLQEHIELSAENKISLPEICAALGTQNNAAIGKVIQKVFPNIKVTRKRNKENWATKTVHYEGISWRKLNNNEISLPDIFGIAKDFFYINESEESVTLGHILNFTLNSTKPIIEIKFQRDLQWFLSVCGKTKIQPQDFGMNNFFKLEHQSIAGIFDGIRNLRVCKGVNSKDEFKDENDIIKEIFTLMQEDNSPRTVFRSVNCNRVINFRSHQSAGLCSVCRDALKNNKRVNKDSSQVPPSQDHAYIQTNVRNSGLLPLTDITNTIGIKNAGKSKDSTSDHNYITCSKRRQSESSESEIFPKKRLKQQDIIESKICKDKVKDKIDCEQIPETNSISLNKTDNKDIETILNELTQSNQYPPKILEFLTSQKAALSAHPNGRRWNINVIRLCLTLWCRSPKSYQDLRESGFVVLPSQKILQIHKNKFHQKAGLNKEILHWMKNEALHKNIPPEGYEGGLILDEMSIQSDLQFYSKNGKSYLIGFTDICDESLFMDEINSGKRETTLATHVLQYVFLGFTGFRFPIFHVPTKQATAAELCILFWKITNLLLTFGFKIKYISMDGAQTNRDFAKILLGNFHSATISSMRIQNIFAMSNQNIYIIMDYSHIMKKIRNNLMKSGSKSSYKRHLCHNGHFIYWEHLKVAYLWDISHNPFPVHYKLSHEHFHLTSEAKMRNHLAEDVLNKEMLHLLKTYRDNLPETKQTELIATIELLENTSILIDNFRDHRPITCVADVRLEQNKKVLNWFQNWEKSVMENSEIKDKEKSLISHQTRADICSLLIGFDELCADKLKNNASSIVPNRINSDVIENVFCQQRGLYNGNNTNPTYLNYCRTMNAVILGQATISRKSNAGVSQGAAEPFSIQNFKKPA